MSDRNRILVTGANGQVGQEFVRRLDSETVDLIATDRSMMDITNADEVMAFLERTKPDVLSIRQPIPPLIRRRRSPLLPMP